ncbi:MAG TPA: hypothetical protein VMX18_01375 [Candidatus Bipolaricaulota bacterium]|nr:hypothetical protein [Candidatus Bipolaricaulota bacterium]
MKYQNSKTLPNGKLIRKQTNKYLWIFIFILLVIFASIFWESYTLAKWAYDQNNALLLIEINTWGFDLHSVKTALNESAKQSPILNAAINMSDYRSIFNFIAWIIFAYFLGTSAKTTELPEFNKLKESKKLYSKAPLLPIILGIVILVGVNYAMVYSSAYSASYTAKYFSPKTNDLFAEEEVPPTEEGNLNEITPPSITDDSDNDLVIKEDVTPTEESNVSVNNIQLSNKTFTLKYPKDYQFEKIDDRNYLIKKGGNELWKINFRTLADVEELDKKCPPDDCMRNEVPLIQTDRFEYEMKLWKVKADAQKDINKVDFEFDSYPVGHDVGYFHSFSKYFDDVRVAFTGYDPSDTGSASFDFMAEFGLLIEFTY